MWKIGARIINKRDQTWIRMRLLLSKCVRWAQLTLVTGLLLLRVLALAGQVALLAAAVISLSARDELVNWSGTTNL